VLSARVPAVDTDRARLQAARRAAQVTPVAQLLEVARQDQTAALAANAAAGTRVASASRAADIATGALRAEQARGEARLAAQRTVAKLEAILPQARRLGVLRNGVALASTGLAAAQVALTAKAKARDAAVAAAKTLEGELELARRDGANAQALLQLGLARERATRVARCRQLDAELGPLRESLAAAEAGASRAMQTRDTARVDASGGIGLAFWPGGTPRRWREAWRTLPRLRWQGPPCAGAADAGAGDRRGPRYHASRLQHADEALADAQAVRQKAEANVAQCQVRLADLREGAGDVSDAGVQALDQEIQTLTASGAKAEAAATRAERLAAQTIQARQAQESAEAAVQAAEGALRTAMHEHAQLDGEWRAASAQVPEDSRDPDVVTASLEAAQREAGALEAALQAAQGAERDAVALLAGANAALAAAREATTRAEERAAQRDAAFVEALATAGFAGADDYRAASLADDATRVLDDAVRAFDVDLARAANGANARRKSVRRCRRRTCLHCWRHAMRRPFSLKRQSGSAANWPPCAMRCCSAKACSTRWPPKDATSRRATRCSAACRKWRTAIIRAA
jgi:exonuclease SbcC